MSGNIVLGRGTQDTPKEMGDYSLLHDRFFLALLALFAFVIICFVLSMLTRGIELCSQKCSSLNQSYYSSHMRIIDLYNCNIACTCLTPEGEERKHVINRVFECKPYGWCLLGFEDREPRENECKIGGDWK